MQILEKDGEWILQKERTPIGRCRFEALPGQGLHGPDAAKAGPCAETAALRQGAVIRELCILPKWRRKGYGSYLLKSLLARTGGYDRGAESLHTVPAPETPGEAAFWRKFGFAPAENGLWARRRKPDLTAVRFAQQLAALYCPAPRFAIDATCGNGGDTEFLCRLAGPAGGHVLAMDIQPAACAATQARLEAAGIPAAHYHIVCDSHARLMTYAAPESADLILFNFGWLPGAPHDTFSTAESSIPALEAALQVLRPGGVLSAILYSGKVIGSAEKQAVRAWLAGLPLEKYTVLVCDFANWADSAPLPCLVLKK